MKEEGQIYKALPQIFLIFAQELSETSTIKLYWKEDK